MKRLEKALIGDSDKLDRVEAEEFIRKNLIDIVMSCLQQLDDNEREFDRAGTQKEIHKKSRHLSADVIERVGEFAAMAEWLIDDELKIRNELDYKGRAIGFIKHRALLSAAGMRGVLDEFGYAPDDKEQYYKLQEDFRLNAGELTDDDLNETEKVLSDAVLEFREEKLRRQTINKDVSEVKEA